MSTPHDPWWDGLAADPSRGPAAPPDRPATEAGADDQAAPVHTAPHEPVAEAE
ncbi:MAG: hypothetical protein JWN08_2904, partial [Frankiales bacterium]|nr:hypothetical protein [Frankiales bacterium]